MGSVKDLIVLKKPVKDKSGKGRFSFSDRYSVFDWGEMPDHIPNKGASLCVLSAYFFEKLEELGIKSHYLGLVEGGQAKKLLDVRAPSTLMEISLLRVIEPEIKGDRYDYSVYEGEKGNFLIPLEIIYRNSLPEGSSVFRRLEEGSLKLEDIGLKEMPLPGKVYEEPILDFSTKLESSDRYLNPSEAKEIARLSIGEMEEVKQIALTVSKLITEEVNKVGLFNEDGKIELGFDENRNFLVVDALGTLDECRFTYSGFPVSKEIARVYYRKTPWFQELEEAKKKDKIKWKGLVKNPPPPLPPRLKDLISELYCTCANEITQREWFKNTPPLKELIEQIKQILL